MSSQERIDALPDEVLNKLLKQEDFRKKTVEHIKEHIGTVEFMEIVQKYATQEINKRIYKSGIFWFTIVGIPISVAVISAFIIKAIVTN